MRFFYGQNASRPIKASGRLYLFEVTGRIAGTTQGVIKFVDHAEADTFFAVARTFGVREITEAEYDAETDKKKETRFSPSSLGSSQKPQPVRLKQAAGVVVAAPASVEPETQDPVDLVEIGVVAEPPHEPLLDTAPKKRRKR